MDAVTDQEIDVILQRLEAVAAELEHTPSAYTFYLWVLLAEAFAGTKPALATLAAIRRCVMLAHRLRAIRAALLPDASPWNPLTALGDLLHAEATRLTTLYGVARPAPARRALAPPLAAFQAALPGSRGAAYLRQRGMPLALAQQLGVGSAAPGTWPHPTRDWRGGRVVFPHTTPDGYLVNLYGRAVGTAAQVPKAKRHDHLPGEKGYFNAAVLRAGAGPLWVCEGAFDALALLAAGVPRVVAILGVQGWRWDWARAVRALVFALDGRCRGPAAVAPARPPGGAVGQARGGA